MNRFSLIVAVLGAVMVSSSLRLAQAAAPTVTAAEASAGRFAGVPEYSFKESSVKGEPFDSAAAMAKCKKVLPAEKAKVTKLGFTVVSEIACYIETNTVNSFVAGSFQFLGKH